MISHVAVENEVRIGVNYGNQIYAWIYMDCVGTGLVFPKRVFLHSLIVKIASLTLNL